MSQPERERTIFDEGKMKLTAPPLEKGGRPANFKVGLFYNNPQFVVFPGDSSGIKVINAGMDVGTFYFALHQIRWLATEAADGETIKIENHKDIPKEKRQGNERRAVSTETLIGRDKDGRIWISVKDMVRQNAPLVRFYFEPSFYHKVAFKIQETDRGVISRAFAQAWCDMVISLMGPLLAERGGKEQHQYQAPNKGGAGGGSGWNNKGSGNAASNYNNKGATPPEDNFDDSGFDEGF